MATLAEEACTGGADPTTGAGATGGNSTATRPTTGETTSEAAWAVQGQATTTTGEAVEDPGEGKKRSIAIMTHDKWMAAYCILG